MSDGLIGHYVGNAAKYTRVTRLESAKISHKEGCIYVTWDIGVEYRDLEKEVKEFYISNGYSVYKDDHPDKSKIKKTKYTFVKKNDEQL